MKYFAALCLLSSLAACNVGGLDIYTEHWDVPHAAAADEDAVRYTPMLSDGSSRLVCEDQHSLLMDVAGGRFILTHPVHQGGFSTFHYALDDNDVMWGVKKVPLNSRSAQRPGIGEVALRRQLHLWDALHPETLLHKLLRHGDDAYAVMPLMDGSVAALATLSSRSVLARSMVQQVAGDAARLHALGFVHHDVSAQNLLWSRDGTIALADFNLARRVDKDGRLQRTSWYVVAEIDQGVAVRELIAAPEMRHGRHDGKADTWSLGLAAVDVLLGQPELFDALQKELAGSPEGYARWHASVTTRSGEVNLERIQDPTKVQVPPDRYMYDLAFTRAAQQDRELAKAVLGGLLQPSPQQRWSMQEVLDRAPTTLRESAATALSAAAAQQDAARAKHRDALRACAAQLKASAEPSELAGHAQDPRNTRQLAPDREAVRRLGIGHELDPRAPMDFAEESMAPAPLPKRLTGEEGGASVRY